MLRQVTIILQTKNSQTQKNSKIHMLTKQTQLYLIILNGLVSIFKDKIFFEVTRVHESINSAKPLQT